MRVRVVRIKIRVRVRTRVTVRVRFRVSNICNNKWERWRLQGKNRTRQDKIAKNQDNHKTRQPQ